MGRVCTHEAERKNQYVSGNCLYVLHIRKVLFDLYQHCLLYTSLLLLATVGVDAQVTTASMAGKVTDVDVYKRQVLCCLVENGLEIARQSC